MPELPEVETTRCGLAPHILNTTIIGVIVRNARLRWPIPEDLPELLIGQEIISLTRRAKYLLLKVNTGTLILHLGMSGSLRILSAPTELITEAFPALCCEPPAKHDHFDLLFNNGKLMRLRDPRRFGAILWQTGDDAYAHPLLAQLGPEPLDDDFHADYLYEITRQRRVSIKQFIMDNHVVVGIGNIYASEALFTAGILPHRCADNLSEQQCVKLVDALRSTLIDAISAGGSTLRDFVNSAGNPGYFQQQHRVYGRTGAPCVCCTSPIKHCKQGQRSSYYCEHCQT